MFSLSHACHGVTGHEQWDLRFLRRGSLKIEAQRPSLDCWLTKHDPALSRGVGSEATTTSWLGITSLLGETEPPLHGWGSPSTKW